MDGGADLDERRVGLHVALTPDLERDGVVRRLRAADGALGTERHDTHEPRDARRRSGSGFRQPVRRVAREKLGEEFHDTHDTNPGEVWEENEFWFALSWRIDPDGSLGIRKYFESPYRPGEPVTVDEYYRWVFENPVPGLPEKAAAEGLTPLAYMRKYGVVEIAERPVPPGRAAADGRGARRRGRRRARRAAQADRRRLDAAAGRGGRVGRRPAGRRLARRRLADARPASSSSTRDTAASFGWPEHATPGLHPLARRRLRDRRGGRGDGAGTRRSGCRP